jgi:hypothetical protein
MPARHASPPGNRLTAKPMADGQGEAGGPLGHRRGAERTALGQYLAEPDRRGRPASGSASGP